MLDYKNWCFPDSDTHFQSSVDTFPKTWYQQATIDKAYNYVKDFKCVIDVGANIGLHSVRFASKFDKVLSFEPVSTNFECLVNNTKTFSNVKCFKNGVGSMKEVLTIKVPIDNKNCGAYSFVDFKDFKDTIDEDVQIVKLDDLNIVPDLIKIDTQGFEENVLLGSTKMLKLYSPVIIAEVETKKQKNILNNILKNLEYTCIENHRKDHIWIKK